MKILAMDTSSLVVSVAVMDNGVLLGEYTLNHSQTHSQKLVPAIKEMLANLELVPADIDLYAVSKGPGSFTGLRIGVVTAKAMAYAFNKPVIGIPTLDVLAHNISFCQHIICPIMDARNNQVYTALYRWATTGQERLTEYMGVKIEELADIILQHLMPMKSSGSTGDEIADNKAKDNVKAVFVGDGVYKYRDFFSEKLGESCIIATGNLLLQRASSIAEIALELALKGNITENYFDLVPFYLRKSQAERIREKAENG